MKKIILVLGLIVAFNVSYSQKKYVKKLETAKKTFLFYQDSPFKRVLKKSGRYKKNTIFIEKRCDGVFLIIQTKKIKQNSYYYIYKTFEELEFDNVEDINKFIYNLQHEKD